MKLTNSRLLPLLQLLRSLDGYDKAVEVEQQQPDGSMKTVSKVLREPYRFASGSVYLDLAINQNALSAAADAAEQARVAIVKSLLPDGETSLEKHPAQLQTFLARYQEVLDQEVEVALKPIQAADLDLKANPIPPTALAALVTHGLLQQ